MLLKECLLSGCKDIAEIPDIGFRCNNCDEVFKYDEKYGVDIVSLDEWVEYLIKQDTV